jgi:DNA-binding transcriptional LysR family regulator
VLDDFFNEVGIVPHIPMEAKNVATIKPLVKINLGISIIPYPAVAEETKRQELHCLKIRDYELSREVGLVYHKSEHVPKILSELIRLFGKKQLRIGEMSTIICRRSSLFLLRPPVPHRR